MRARNLALAKSEGELAKAGLLALSIGSLLGLGWLGGYARNNPDSPCSPTHHT